MILFANIFPNLAKINLIFEKNMDRPDFIRPCEECECGTLTLLHTHARWLGKCGQSHLQIYADIIEWPESVETTLPGTLAESPGECDDHTCRIYSSHGLFHISLSGSTRGANKLISNLIIHLFKYDHECK